jgi:hypothetical protein
LPPFESKANAKLSELVLSAVGWPFCALVFFALLESAYSTDGVWVLLTKTGLDLCRISIGVAGAISIDLHVAKADGTQQSYTPTMAVGMLMLELILAAAAILIERRATDMGITRQDYRAFSILGIGLFSIAVPAGLIVLNGLHLIGKT